MQKPCYHLRTEMIARRDGIDYVRCQDCGTVFEAEDLEPLAVPDLGAEDEMID